MAQTIDDRKTRQRLAIGAGLLLMAAFYCWTALPMVNAPNPRPGTAGHYPGAGPGELYNALAEALLAGKTSLLIKPRPELLAIADPYDPLKNHQTDAQGRYCLHDAVLWRGKYYLYFGVTPAVTLFAPFLLLSGHYLPTAVAALVFACAGLASSVLLLNLLVDQFFPTLGAGARFFLVLALGACNGAPFLLRSPYVYEVAILGAYCFTATGLFFLARGTLAGSWRGSSVATGSLCLGLAIGCRPHMALVALIVFVVAALWVCIHRQIMLIKPADHVAKVAALIGPWLLIAVLLGFYNYHRFGSFTEFGARYNLVGGTVRVVDLPVLDWHRLHADLYCYLAHPPVLQSRFPYVQLRAPDPSSLPPGHFGATPIAGVLVGMPFLFLVGLAPVTLLRAWRQRRWVLLATLTVILGSGMLELLCVACFGGAMRYMVDFSHLLVLAALLVGLDLDAWCRPRPIAQFSLRVALAMGLTVGCLFNLGISIEGQRGLGRDLAVRDQLRTVFPRLHLRLL
jgi:hypothetical protein